MTVRESENVLKELTPNCGNCFYAESIPSIGPDGQMLIGETTLVCQRMPPQCVMVAIQTPMGLQQGLRTQFPPVNDGMICHEHLGINSPGDLPPSN